MNIYQLPIFLLCVVTAFGCSQPTAIPETVREGLQGAVKSVLWKQENTVWSENKIVDRRLETMYENQYDRNGYKTSHQKYTWIITPVDGVPYGNHPGTKWKYTVNQFGHRVLTETIDTRGEVNTYFYQYYDDEGYLTLEKYFDRDKNLIRVWIVDRDEENKVNYVTVNNATGVIEGQGEWHYDNNGLYIQKGNTKTDENVWSYHYNEQGTQIFFQQTNFDGNKNVIGYHTEIFDTYGQKQFVFVYDFQQERYAQFVFEYEVDEYGNWIHEMKFLLIRENGQDQKDLVHSRFREIEYYDD